MREVLTRYGRHNIGFLWLFVEPMLFTLGVTALWTALKAVHGSNIPITAFALTGYSSVLLWRNMPNRCVGAVQPNLALMYHRNVRVMDIFLARLLLEAAGASISFLLLSLVFISLGWITVPEDLMKVISGWLMLAWFGFALAILLASYSEEYEIVEKLWHPASYLLFPLSGAAFLVGALPVEAQQYVLYLPMVHAVECIRDGFFGTKIEAHYDLLYMAEVNLVMTFVGLLQTHRISKRVIPE
ncbi:ABC-2 type transport system permease protein/capsular polysaccharide transport system permease protein [Novosphingobium hassiacum]|uniref:ABC-2 type transport system permease protein/capsular polysaccharide transport system permease protein n=2 Tax=Novosphingobium hassiacum TaxID=173676 RepID=A0A7W5ZT05_9SPHN|nr:ABC-2 type transport system permease protein/capsular polysaccharide transport system permease protein [Novosphingobium hassiacum]